jgi:hypothetical protein
MNEGPSNSSMSMRLNVSSLHRHTQTDTQADAQTDTQADAQTDAHRHTHRHTHRHPKHSILRSDSACIADLPHPSWYVRPKHRFHSSDTMVNVFVHGLLAAAWHTGLSAPPYVLHLPTHIAHRTYEDTEMLPPQWSLVPGRIALRDVPVGSPSSHLERSTCRRRQDVQHIIRPSYCLTYLPSRHTIQLGSCPAESLPCTACLVMQMDMEFHMDSDMDMMGLDPVDISHLSHELLAQLCVVY